MLDHDTQSLPALVLDKVELGVSLRITGCGPDPLSRLRHALHRQGVLRPGDRRDEVLISFPVVSDRTDPSLDDRLLVSEQDDQLLVRPASRISINPLRWLRHAMGADAAGEGGLDGKDNVIGPTEGPAIDLLARQLDLVEVAMNRLADELEATMPEARAIEEEVWLRSAEACVDRTCPGAVALVRSLQRSAIAGTRHVVHDAYRRSCGEDGLAPVVRWWRARRSFVFKAYAKRDDLLRLEVACDERDAIRPLAGASEMAFVDGSAVRALLHDFAVAAAGPLAELQTHAHRASFDGATPAELMVALLPLVQLAGRWRTGRGSPPKPKSIIAAKDALDQLVTVGLIRRVRPQETALGSVLNGLAGKGGVLVRSGRHAVFTLRPEFGGAGAGLTTFL